MRTIHATELRKALDDALKGSNEDIYDLYVATLGSTPVVHYRGAIVGNAPKQRYRIKLEDSGQIRTFAMALVLEWESAEVIW